MDAENKIMLLFVGFAVSVGIVCDLAGLAPLQGLLLAFLFFYVSYKLVPEVFSLEETSFELGAWNIVKAGALPYWFLWLVFWTLVIP